MVVSSVGDGGSTTGTSEPAPWAFFVEGAGALGGTGLYGGALGGDGGIYIGAQGTGAPTGYASDGTDTYLVRVTPGATTRTWVNASTGAAASYDAGYGVVPEVGGNDVFMGGGSASGTTIEGENCGGGCAWLLRANPDGSRDWARTMLPDSGSLGGFWSLAGGAGGDVYAVFGYINGTFGGNGAGLGGIDSGVVKYSANGTLGWSTQVLVSSTSTDHGRNIWVGRDSKIHVVIHTLGVVNGCTHAGAGADYDLAHIKLNATTGAHEGTFCLGTAGNEEAIGYRSVALDDASGNLYFCGATSGAFPTKANAGSDDAFITRTSSTGVADWVIQRGGAGADACRSIAWSKDGNLLALVYDLSQAVPHRLLKIAPSTGAVIWEKALGSAAGDGLYSLDVDASLGSIYVFGVSSNTWGGIVPSASRPLVLRLTSDGTAP